VDRILQLIEDVLSTAKPPCLTFFHRFLITTPQRVGQAPRCKRTAEVGRVKLGFGAQFPYPITNYPAAWMTRMLLTPEVSSVRRYDARNPIVDNTSLPGPMQQCECSSDRRSLPKHGFTYKQNPFRPPIPHNHLHPAIVF